MSSRIILSTTLTVAILGAPHAAHAFRPTDDAHSPLVLADGAVPRAHVRAAHGAPTDSPAWARFLAAAGGSWSATWDLDRQAPLRIWGEGIDAPGAVASAAAAASFAQAFLQDHVALLAPGAAATDFVMVANERHGEVRSVGFAQRHRGMRVEGGQVSFRFKHDRMVVMGSEAWPNLDVSKPDAPISAPTAALAASKWIREALGAAGEVESVSEPFVHAVMRADGQVEARPVLRVMVRTTTPVGLYAVDIDLATGAPFARRQTLRFFNGQLSLRVPKRFPGNGTHDVPAALTNVVVNGAATQTDASGVVTWEGATTATVTVTAKGAGATVSNAAGEDASATFSFAADDVQAWDANDDEWVNAQVATYVAAQEVREYVQRVAPELRFAREQVIATVNINDICNAYSDGTTINFFRSSVPCENTGILSDVVHHEYGHSVHAHAIIAGLGDFDGALSEGVSDYLAATYANDPGMGRGFFYTDEPLRHLDPEGREWRWPEDQGESHQTGQIIGGALWDLRKKFVDEFGEEAGVAKVDHYWYVVLQRASSILAAYSEILLEDDDDGNLANGTPNLCDITEVFRAHGLAEGASVGLTIGEVSLAGFQVRIPLASTGLCPGFEVSSVKASWARRGAGVGGTLDMGKFGDLYAVDLPLQPEGEVLQYSVEVGLTNGETLHFPDNPADPMYEAFIGEVREIYCTNFEADPMSAGWVSEMVFSGSGRGRNEWEWGRPQAPGSGDPTTAYSGTRVIGNDLGINSSGTYQRNKVEQMVSPVIDVGEATSVRLQYRRWLTVEDGLADQAEILVGGRRAWTNARGNGDLHHLDKEWRFHDVDITTAVQRDDGQAQVSFRLTSNGEVGFGGWTVDDFCIVAWDGPVAACGDGKMDFGEACDDGNDVSGDGCEADCSVTRVPACGDGIVDSGEQCDDGNQVAGDGCEATCVPSINGLNPEVSGCGCTAAETSGARASSAVLVLGLALILLARRRFC